MVICIYVTGLCVSEGNVFEYEIIERSDELKMANLLQE